MFTFTGPGSAQTCTGITRRDFLQAGALGAIGLSLPHLFAAKAKGAVVKGHDNRSVIMIFNLGAPSQLDTFDMKPDAPAEVRGDFRPIPTNVDGIQICEHLPRTAQVMDRVALIRSLTHELGNHDTGSHYLLTGHRPTPVVEYPSLGSIVARETGFHGAIPPYVAVPEAVASAKSGYLPAAFSPFSVGGDPSKPGYYLTINHFPPGVMSRPHYHPDERYIIVLRGTWYTDEGEVFRPNETIPLKPGDFMRHPKGGPHYDGALNEDTWVAISGYGPTKATVIDGGELFGKSR